jgi:hypothetical protein
MLSGSESDSQSFEEQLREAELADDGERRLRNHALRLARLAQYEAHGLAQLHCDDACFTAANAKLMALIYQFEQDIENARKQGASSVELAALYKTYRTMLQLSISLRRLELQATNLQFRINEKVT